MADKKDEEEEFQLESTKSKEIQFATALPHQTNNVVVPLFQGKFLTQLSYSLLLLS